MCTRDLPPSPLEDWSNAPFVSGRELFIKRDDLLPFPLAGNKVRKLFYELADIDLTTTTILTVGAVNSNHCRTAAMIAARRGGQTHLILHGDVASKSAQFTLTMLKRLGATWEVVEPGGIRNAIHSAQETLPGQVHFIPGGCHTPAGVAAYSSAVYELEDHLDGPPDLIVHASGTGATQAGIIAGCHNIGWKSTRVFGVSVARDAKRGTESIREALSWQSLEDLPIELSDEYRAGGYGLTDQRVTQALETGWRNGLPLDGTYTAKAFSALLDEEGPATRVNRVVFWHTGGLNTQIMMDADSS
ncbi:1-aminocyclopropane-1-carboxylate deaminase/D-cysteine desulfhydrase [Dietzia psychralcaliphila]|uniref:1-aminocyclopropane-1-carboxylate deaminase/D-cysteine desulfhydrase n=1 Tax=Dietzia TaxID=37914 RepID=UPI0015FB8FA6|nr:pyridoxal-phosphate dependent enzyme [Dietzia natronolimnaea]